MTTAQYKKEKNQAVHCKSRPVKYRTLHIVEKM